MTKEYKQNLQVHVLLGHLGAVVKLVNVAVGVVEGVFHLLRVRLKLLHRHFQFALLRLQTGFLRQ